jgi:hypothetical protein
MSDSWRTRRELNPFGTVVGAAAVLLGGQGIVLGDGVSQGMTNSLHAQAALIAHLWGVVLALGGALKLAGLFGGRSAIEIVGLWMMCGGFGFYCVTVVTGLAAHGLAAGTISGALAVGSYNKVRIIMRRARRAARAVEQ